MRITPILPILILASALFSGCSISPTDNFQYFAIIHDVQSGDTQHIMLEHGKEKTFYLAEGTGYFFWWPFPFVVADGSVTGQILFTRRVYWWDLPAAWEIAYPAQGRSAGALQQLARGMSPTPYWINDVKQENAPRHWILSNKPMILAIGTDIAPIDRYGKTYSIPELTDLDRTASELLILDKWPNKKDPWGPNDEKAFEALLAERVRRHKLPSPLTLREILTTRPWQSSIPQSFPVAPTYYPSEE